jgi:hypothetical protein
MELSGRERISINLENSIVRAPLVQRRSDGFDPFSIKRRRNRSPSRRHVEADGGRP